MSSAAGESTLGDMVDGFGIELKLEDGDLVQNLVVLARVLSADGHASVSMVTDDGTCTVAQYGMVAMAMDSLRDAAHHEEL